MPVEGRVASDESSYDRSARSRLWRLAIGALGLFWVGVLLVLMR